MTKHVWFLVSVAALFCQNPAAAAIRYVSQTGAGSYSSIAAAYTASAVGDTILIGPGTYLENGPNSFRRLTWIGAGWDQTILNVSGSVFYMNTGSNGSVVEGMRIINGNSPALSVVNSADSISIRRCLLEHTGGSGSVLEAMNYSSRLYVEDCILMQGTNYFTVGIPNAATLFRNCVFAQGPAATWACFYSTSGLAGTLELYNCVFLNHSTIFNLTAGSLPVIAVNNVFYDWGASPSFGLYSGSSTFDYNASQTIAAPGTNGIGVTTNPFVTYDPANNFVYGISNLHLAAGSNLINAGHPNLLDLDNSRSDCGIYGGPKPLVDLGVPNYPWALNIVLNPNVIGPGTPVNASALGRVGPQY